MSTDTVTIPRAALDELATGLASVTADLAEVRAAVERLGEHMAAAEEFRQAEALRAKRRATLGPIPGGPRGTF